MDIAVSGEMPAACSEKEKKKTPAAVTQGKAADPLRDL
jgi:hypothetical protein